MFHKMITRIVATAVTLCVTLAEIPVFAAAFARSTNTFSLIETNNGATFASEGSWELPADKKAFPNDDSGDVHVYDGANGKFGKDSTDRCMYLWNDTEADTSKVATGNRYQYVRLVNKAQTNITSGQCQELSFSIAYSGVAGTKYMMLVMSPSTSAVDFFKINPDTSITVFGKKVDNVSIRPNKWYQLRFVFIKGEDTCSYKLYIDDYLVGTYTLSNAFTGIAEVRMGQFIFEKTGSVDTEALKQKKELYFDDLILKSSASEPTYNALKLRSTNPHIHKYIRNDGIIQLYTTETMVADDARGTFIAEDEEITAVLKDCSGYDRSIYEAQEDEETPLLKDSYLKITRADGSVLYETFYTDSDQRYSQEITAAATDATPKNWSVSKNANTTINYVNGLSGRMAEDYSIVMNTVDYNASETDYNPYLRMNRSVFTSDFNVPIHIELSILATAENCNAPVVIDYATGIAANTASETWQTALTLRSDLSISDGTGNIVGRFKQNEWNHVVVSVYPAAKLAELTVNGKSVSLTDIKNTDMNRFVCFRIRQNFAKGVGKTYTGSFAIDDYKVYTGVYQPSNEGDIALASNDYTIYNKAKMIYLPQAVGTFDFYSNINGYPTAVEPVIFTDRSLSTVVGEMGEITAGNVLMVSDGKYYRYYDIKIGDGRISYTIDGMAGTDKKFSAGALVVTAATEDVAEDEKANLIIAQYDSKNRLINCSISDENDVFNGLAECAITIEQTEDTIVRVLLFEGMEKMNPLMPAFELLPAEN